jgi:hypothetical protein
MTLSQPERIALLRALKAALAAIDAEEAARVIETGSATQADRWRTPYGTVTIASKDDSIVITDSHAVLQHVKETAPTEIQESVRPAYLSHLLADLVIDGDQVVSVETGEVVPWAKVKHGEPYVSTSGEARKKAIERWEQILTERLESIEPNPASIEE